ncbi:capsule biosynthesis protein [Gymnodinialimonas sp. 2305UL16-5]|uniref:capsule biosynthesis protein n=1 Tax=Gymnodinialimonas mytili TaxID=3126503 RepID=UPI0030AB9A97
MTTKPKARKFRIRQSNASASAARTGNVQAPQPEMAPDASAAPDNSLPNVTEDGFGNTAFPGSAAHDRAQAPASNPPDVAAQKQVSQAAADVRDEIEAIRAEALTGRQLRMARRKAQKHGLQPSSDFDAVRLLRQRGIDPFGGGSMLELVQPDRAKGTTAPSSAIDSAASGQSTKNLPVAAASAKTPAVPPPGTYTAENRAAEIIRVQRDIARRRRRKLVQLATRLSIFVFLPTLLVSYYFYMVATPMYATNTEFVIQKAEASSGGAGGGLGGLLGGGGFATAQESITVQSYLQSREAMLRLDEELDFRGHFSGDNIDVLTRLEPDASNEQMYDTYIRNLTIGYDPTEGLVRMEVLAADPAVSQAFSEALVTYAEERVDQMSSRLREDQMVGARESFEDAETRVLSAQTRVLNLQEQRGVLSAEAEVNQVFGQISNFELQLSEERLRLAEIQAAARPNATRVEVAEANIARLESVIANLRESLTGDDQGEVSLARIQSELVIAQADLETRQLMLTEALQAMESARIEANRQTLYISMATAPLAPDEAAFPKAFENTLLALVVFSGIYLLVSMTASILREQVSS